MSFSAHPPAPPTLTHQLGFLQLIHQRELFTIMNKVIFNWPYGSTPLLPLQREPYLQLIKAFCWWTNFVFKWKKAKIIQEYCSSINVNFVLPTGAILFITPSEFQSYKPHLRMTHVYLKCSSIVTQLLRGPWASLPLNLGPKTEV